MELFALICTTRKERWHTHQWQQGSTPRRGTGARSAPHTLILAGVKAALRLSCFWLRHLFNRETFLSGCGFIADGRITVICSANAEEGFVMECALLGLCHSPAHVFYMLLSFSFFFSCNSAERSIQHHLWAEAPSHGTLHPGSSPSPATGSILESGNAGSELRGPWKLTHAFKMPQSCKLSKLFQGFERGSPMNRELLCMFKACRFMCYSCTIDLEWVCFCMFAFLPLAQIFSESEFLNPAAYPVALLSNGTTALFNEAKEVSSWNTEIGAAVHVNGESDNQLYVCFNNLCTHLASFCL